MSNLVQLLRYLSLGGEVIASIVAAAGQFAAGAPVTTPPIRTYIDGKHVAVSITVTLLP